MLSQLSWLPPPPADFRAQVAGLLAQTEGDFGEDMGDRVLRLATLGLDDAQLRKMALVASAISRRSCSLPGFDKLRLGVLGDGTLSLLGPAICGSALRHRLIVEVVEGGFNTPLQDAMDPASPLRAADLDMALIASDARLHGLDRAARTAAEAHAKVDDAFRWIQRVVSELRPSVRSAILVQTVTPPVEALFGSFDRVEVGAPFAMAAALNQRLTEWAAEGDVILVDVARLASHVGLERWDDPRHWLASKIGFSPDFIAAYADLVARTLSAIRGKSRKCLVLDLDNTIWGGVIGDDGLEGIELGQGSATGEAFLAIQRMALELRERGVLLAVCSKNDEAVARRPFRDHPDMLLREDDIAVFQANWTDKAANLRAIAQALNIGIDALVLLDDNPAERFQVRGAEPLVAVPELPDDPALYPRTLIAAGYFEAVAVSEEDRNRASYYRADSQRASALAASTDMDGYLASLEMVCTITPFDAISRARVAQLVNKSNQFNLTTRRYSEAEILAAETDERRYTAQIRLLDRFGDNGLIGVIIADKGAQSWSIDTWLMSCRVLGRRVQEAALAALVRAARGEGAQELVGRYVPSAKNQMVRDHYQNLGFEPLTSTPAGESTWRMRLDHYVEPELPMQVRDLLDAGTTTAA